MDIPVIALLTDFGLDDPYVGQLKGVLATRAPQAKVVDLSHGLEPFCVAQAAFFARASVEYFPIGTIFVCVVDPGVGSDRRVVLLSWRERLFLAPDNGLSSLLLHDGAQGARAFNVSPCEPLSSATFHGRDLFAPLAARLANGERPESLGTEIDPASLVGEMWAAPREKGGRVFCSVLHADRFGNLVLNLPTSEWAARYPVDVTLRAQAGVGRTVGFGTPGPSRMAVRVVNHYAELAPSELGLLAGSQGFLELALNQASARKLLGIGPGDGLVLETQLRGR